MIAVPNDYKAILAMGAVAVVAYWIIKRDVAAGAAKVATAVNPLSDQNIVNKAVSATGAVLTGRKDFSLGSFIYDLVNKPYDPNNPGTPLLRRAAGASSPVRPEDRPSAFVQ